MEKDLAHEFHSHIATLTFQSIEREHSKLDQLADSMRCSSVYTNRESQYNSELMNSLSALEVLRTLKRIGTMKMHPSKFNFGYPPVEELIEASIRVAPEEYRKYLARFGPTHTPTDFDMKLLGELAAATYAFHPPNNNVEESA